MIRGKSHMGLKKKEKEKRDQIKEATLGRSSDHQWLDTLLKGTLAVHQKHASTSPAPPPSSHALCHSSLSIS